MDHSKQTLTFVVVAAVTLAVAAMTHQSTKPPVVDGYDSVGTTFYPKFTDPNEASAIRLVNYNEDTAKLDQFSVELKDGLWRIPSHHDYPADGKDRLKNTATSIIEIERGRVKSRREADHERLGVIDPLDEDATSLKGRGQRLTLFAEGDTILVDFIIGKKVAEKTDEYYVRREDENTTYHVKLNIDFSTKFGDWIETDLLKLERDNLVSVGIEVPQLSPDGQFMADDKGDPLNKDDLSLSRTSSTDDWKLQGLNEETEELADDKIRTMVGALDDLKIVGIRNRLIQGHQILTGDLQIEMPEALRRNQALAQVVFGQQQQILRKNGFMLYEDSDKKRNLLSREGNMTAATKQGIVYHLHFGNIFTGSLDDIEIGTDEVAEELEDGEEAKEQKAEEPKAEDDTEEKPGLAPKEDEQESRYLFVRAVFDASYLGDAPVAPVEPRGPAADEKPEDKSDNDEAKPEAEKADDSKKKADDAEAKADDGDADAEKKTNKAEEAKPEAPKPDPKLLYEAALQKYNADKLKYESDLKSYEAKVEDGEKLVKELNDRFGKWYYVISADSFDKLRLARADMVKEKEKTDEEKAEDAKTETPTPAETTPPAKSPATPKKSDEKAVKKKPVDEKPAANEKPEEKKPVDDKKPESKPTAEPKPNDDAEKKEAAKPADSKPPESKPEDKPKE